MSYTHRGIELDADIQGSIDRYVNDGMPTGGFLQACIENDLKQAVGRADEDSLRQIPAIVGYLYNRVDSRCWGRSGACAEWINLKRSVAR